MANRKQNLLLNRCPRIHLNSAYVAGSYHKQILQQIACMGRLWRGSGVTAPHPVGVNFFPRALFRCAAFLRI